MKRFLSFCSAVFITAISVIMLTSSVMPAFALTVDGSISQSEIDASNVEVQCDGNSGNGICTLITYYSAQTSRSSYIAFNCNIARDEITSDSQFAFEIYINDKPAIIINAAGNVEYNQQFFHVRAAVRCAGLGATCEAVVDFKYEQSGYPSIRVRVIDLDGVPSKFFDLDTEMTPIDQVTTPAPTAAPPSTKSPTSSGAEANTSAKSTANQTTSKTTKAEKTTKQKAEKTTKVKKATTSTTKTSAASKSSKAKSTTLKSNNKNLNSKINANSDSAEKDSRAADASGYDDIEYQTYTLTDDSLSTSDAAGMRRGIVAVCAAAIAAMVISVAILIGRKSSKNNKDK